MLPNLYHTLLVLLAAIGLVLPGYAFTRALPDPRARFAAGFLLSTVFLFHAVLLTATLRIPLTFWPVAAMLAALTAAGFLFTRNSPTTASLPTTPREPFTPIDILLLALAAASVAIIVQQSLVTPLAGFDTIFRWGFLPKQMLATGHFDYLPPRTPEHFNYYSYPDGFPPGISFTYWWLYAAAGRPVPQLTGVPVLLQHLATLAFTYLLAQRITNSRRAGLLAVALIAASTFYLRTLAMAQETGLIAAAVTGLLYLLDLTRGPSYNRRSTLLLAAATAAVPALCREYGWAFTALAAATVLYHHRALKPTVLFSAAAAVLAAPWYVRNALLTGNPVYSLALGPLPINRIYYETLIASAPAFSIFSCPAHVRREALTYLLTTLPLQLAIGLPAAIALTLRRHNRPELLLATLLAFALWAHSTKFTNGGPIYATRVLQPAIPLLSVAAAVWLSRLTLNTQRLAATVLTLACGYSLLNGYLYPFQPSEVPPRQWLATGLTVHARRLDTDDLADDLPRLLPRGARILADSTAAWVAFRDRGYAVVPVWSPEVAFLVDPTISPADMRTRLRALHITAALVDAGSAATPWLLAHSPYYQTIPTWTPLTRRADLTLFRLP